MKRTNKEREAQLLAKRLARKEEQVQARSALGALRRPTLDPGDFAKVVRGETPIHTLTHKQLQATCVGLVATVRDLWSELDAYRRRDEEGEQTEPEVTA